MKKSQAVWSAFLAAAGMLILILDAKTALNGAYEGLSLCIRTVIPSLFPFFVLSSLLTGSLAGFRSKHLKWIGTCLGIPSGAEVIWITGLLGGYPIGAKCICQAYENGSIDSKTARRLLGFCSNAGPAFIFGMTSLFFPDNVYPWHLFFIQIFSSFLTGILLPGKTEHTFHPAESKRVGWNQALLSSLHAMAGVCGWIILFRVILSVCNRWFLWLLQDESVVILTGLMELSNGILSLDNIPSVAERFILCAAMLNFGGLCVIMQTAAVTGALGLGAYLPGKLLQTMISVFLASALCTFRHGYSALCSILSAAGILLFVLYFGRKKKKTVAIPRGLMYNG